MYWRKKMMVHKKKVVIIVLMVFGIFISTILGMSKEKVKTFDNYLESFITSGGKRKT